MATEIRQPDADISVGTWTTAPLWSKINEGSGLPNGIYIVSPNNANTTGECSVQDSTNPGTYTAVEVRAYARKSAAAGNQRGLDGDLRIGGGLRGQKTFQANLTENFTQYIQSWTGLNFTRTDMDSLQVLFISTGTTGGSAANKREVHVDYIELVLTYTPEATDRKGRVSWAEFQTPDAARKGKATWAELQTPPAARRGIATWAEAELPPAARAGRSIWAELEMPEGPRKGKATWAELETPEAPRSALATWAEMQLPEVGRTALLTWAEAETPIAPRWAVLTWSELETPLAQRRGVATWAEIELPSAALRSALATWAELQTPDATRAARLMWAELYLMGKQKGRICLCRLGLIEPDECDHDGYED